ncbi:MAG: hypothetical protein GXO97_01645 [Nitrospirae bacterium]|nr:hypothetical protein [Nitrospirota bacterium]
MGNTVSLSVKLNVAGGPSLSVSKSIEAEAYDKINVTVEAGTTQPVEIQPGETGQIQLLLIKSSRYSEDLTYKVHDTDSTSITLDEPQIYMGSGSVKLLGSKIDKLLVSNGMSDDAEIEIFVCRDATPSNSN